MTMKLGPEIPIPELPAKELWHKAIRMSRFEELRLVPKRRVQRPVVEPPADGKVTDSLRAYELRAELLPGDQRMDRLKALYLRRQKAKVKKRVKINVRQED